MSKDLKRAILEARVETRRVKREQRIAVIHARIEERRAEHEQKLYAIHAKIEARKAERHPRKAVEPVIKAEPNRELQAMREAMMARHI